MKKVFEIRNLDCACCAAKMEDAIRKIDGVNSVTVSFIGQKITLETEQDEFDKIIKKVGKICRRIEPDCEIIY